MKEVTINGISFSVGLADVWGGKMWFFCECHQDCRPSIYWFWTKKSLKTTCAHSRAKPLNVKYWQCCARYMAEQYVTRIDSRLLEI